MDTFILAFRGSGCGFEFCLAPEKPHLSYRIQQDTWQCPPSRRVRYSKCSDFVEDNDVTENPWQRRRNERATRKNRRQLQEMMRKRPLWNLLPASVLSW